MATILITGAAQRIGLDIAKHFLGKGYQLIVTYRTKHASVAELEQLGAICLSCDFEQPDAVDVLVEQVKSFTSELSAIIHNASSWDCESKNPDFCYTIGLEHSYKHPEILIFGLNHSVAHQILADLVLEIQNNLLLILLKT